MAASAALHARRRHRGGRLGAGQRGGGRDAVLRQRTLSFELPHILVVGRRRLRELRLRLRRPRPRPPPAARRDRRARCARSPAPRRTRVPSSKSSVCSRPPVLTPTSLLRRATTYPVATRIGNRRRAAVGGRRDLRGARDFDFGRALPVVVLARRRVEPTPPTASTTASSTHGSQRRRGATSRSMRKPRQIAGRS